MYEDGTLSVMLENWMRIGVQLYKDGASSILLLSGDGQTTDYDEPEATKRYAVEQGGPKEAIVLDKAGLSIYEAVYCAARTVGYTPLAIVTLEYNLYRAVYVTNALDVKVVGISASLQGVVPN